MIYHITTQNWWNTWDDKDFFESPDLDEDGFLHCCTQQQLKIVLNKYFKGLTELVILHIDPELVEPELKYEPSDNYQLYPHIYGSLNRNAIVEIEFYLSNQN